MYHKLNKEYNLKYLTPIVNESIDLMCVTNLFEFSPPQITNQMLTN